MRHIGEEAAAEAAMGCQAGKISWGNGYGVSVRRGSLLH